MAHGKETPRQKMIGMMYLVLTAMLALNVSTSYLKAFALVDTGLTRTTKNYSIKNEKLYTEFENAYTLNKVKVGPWKNKTAEIKKQATEIIDFVQDIKIEIVKEGDGPEAKALEGRVINSELIVTTTNTHIGTLILIGPQGNGKAFELKRRLIKFREYLISIVDAQKAPELITSLNGILNTDDPLPRPDGTVQTWESSRFEGIPLIADMPQLTKVQVDVLNCEAEVVNYLLQQVGANDFKFNVLNATVIPASSSVILGNEYKAKIFLAASDTTQRPKIYICSYDSTFNKESGEYNYNIKGGADTIQVSKRGIGYYKARATSLGKKAVSGLIEMKSPDGSITRKPFRNDYIVEASSAVISPTKMNVFYLDVENPVEISVPGISMDKISATISKGVIRPTGKDFIVQPGQGIAACDITVSAVIDGVKRVVSTRTFKVKPLPQPYTKVAGISGKTATKNEMASAFGVVAQMPPDFDFDLKYTVTGFTISAAVGSFTSSASSKSPSITEEQKRILNSLRPGSQVTITDVKAVGPNGVPRELTDLVIKIK